ncbi:unnamed protein product [Cyprideis torosa]|uniref:Uncharacterized protein n=1 Tax=Cyprideis torosa TaxID=163714 RepID=A0A7R8W8N9_9CRUS|nr:unnamed protein product [Cyprideis torosa]CAG0887667.1 unnamed protein product [Cyprideis torosa]
MVERLGEQLLTVVNADSKSVERFRSLAKFGRLQTVFDPEELAESYMEQTLPASSATEEEISDSDASLRLDWKFSFILLKALCVHNDGLPLRIEATLGRVQLERHKQRKIHGILNSVNLSPKSCSNETSEGKKQLRPSGSQEEDAEGTDDSEGNSYIYGVIWASILLFLWRHPAWFSLLPIPFVFSVIKYIGAYFEIWDFISSQWNTLSKNASFTALRYREVVAPRCIRLPLRALKRGDRALAFALEDYVDLISTVAVIVLVLIILTCSFIWTALAVYGEGSYLVDVSGRAINETITRNSEFLPAGFYDMIQQQSHMVHGYGREWISQLVKQVSGQGDPEKSQQLEQEVLVFWDKIYAEYVRYMATPSTLEKNLSESLPAPDEGYSDSELEGGGPGNDTETEDDSGWSESYKKLTRSMSFHTSINLIRNNLDVVQSVSETTFGILKENLHLAASTFTLLFSLLLGGGSAVLNILLNFIIFATSLFYILNASGEYYMPVDLIASFTPRHTTKYSVAMEESVYAVFLVTLRMAIFNGIWTWLIHSALSVQLVCIPSVLAGIFSAVPLVGTYFAAIPGIIELWLIEERPYAAILLLIAQMFPIYFVNDEFYKGIKGGIHPYIIGLSVMGGVLCIGVQGAILGPVLLCSLLIALNIYKGAIKSSPWETIQERMRGRAFNRRT